MLRRDLGPVPLFVTCNFGGGDSSSSSSSSTTNVDKRQVVSDFGIGVSSDSSSVSVTTSDPNNYAAAVDLAKTGAENAARSFEQVVGTADKALDRLLDAQMQGWGFAERVVDKVFGMQADQAQINADVVRAYTPQEFNQTKAGLTAAALVIGGIVLVAMAKRG